jgi:hypothetical protein
VTYDELDGSKRDATYIHQRVIWAFESTVRPLGKSAPTEGASSNPVAPSESPAQPLAPSGDDDVEVRLALANKRGAAIRAYLSASHGIDPKRMTQYRTAYSDV